MAKSKSKKSKFDFSAFLSDLQENQTEERVVGNEVERQYFLIVCEGEKTEPNYFNALIEKLPTKSVSVEILGEGTNTINVVEKAIERREERTQSRLKPPFDEVWAVFDRDSFPAERFNEAIDLGRRENIGTAYSNEAFELWYILHFEFLNTGISRDQYITKLKRILTSYAKNSTNIYQILQEKGNEEQAIKRAKKLLEEHKDSTPASAKPTTKVHELVEKLNEFKL